VSLEHEALGLVDAIYQAAIEPKRWPSFLTRLGEKIGADALCIFLRYPQVNDPGQVFSVGVEPALELAYTHYYFAKVPWAARAGAIKEGTVAVGEDVICFEELQKTEFYNDWLRPRGLRYLLGANIRNRGGASFLNLGAVRSTGARPFGPGEQRLCARLVPHLQRAVNIHERTHQIAAERDALRQTLDRLSIAVITTDAQGRVSWLNPAAEEVVRQRDGLMVDRSGLSALSPCENPRLRKLIVDAGQSSSASRPVFGGALSVTRPSGRRPLNVLVTSLRRAGGERVSSKPVAAIFVSDPEQRGEVPIASLRGLYGLTPAEASLAALLGAGWTLAEAAHRLGIVLSTARTQLRSIFAKTDTHQQAALVRLITGGVAALRPS
jgi:DNA-binding NarL/FixJ family response regulator